MLMLAQRSSGKGFERYATAGSQLNQSRLVLLQCDAADGFQGQRIEARALRETVLSAGAIGSVQVLEHSGVGRGAELQAAGKPVHIIGGADVAAELDAKRAIRQGAELAAVI